MKRFASTSAAGQLVSAVVIACAAAVLGLGAAPGLADEPSPELAKYTDRVDKSVDKALAYLAKIQQPDGTFAGRLANNSGVNSLCVMAFLAKGHTPGAGPYGGVINKGIDAVIASQQPSGLLLNKSAAHGPMYSHTISTLMLSEVSGMVDAERQKKVDVALGKALRLIISAQDVQKPEQFKGGWRYQPTSRDADISCTGWALMSLRSARNNGAEVPKSAVDKAVGFVMRCRGKDGGFAYQPGGGSGLARTGTALLCLELAGKHRDKVTLAAGEYVLKNMPRKFGGGFFYYSLYYCSQGMYQLGGEYWQRFAAGMYEMMLKFQKPDGSWPAGVSNEQVAGESYSTAMSVLAMSVSYCQLPIYQR
ncbi:MAG TPA: prenyltransferase/squalene oxidase repeat-containing protein [Phycisphaerae bacterium]|nr:prenyltransferase/squalene oxidase repeat-containing protein [Phycisphaerae bacterium]